MKRSNAQQPVAGALDGMTISALISHGMIATPLSLVPSGGRTERSET
jgi:hypothetical protein